jgi:thiol-disulfide isomerase/thioredoxin
MHKYLLSLLFALAIGFHSNAKDGYTIKVKFTDAKDSLVYLCHYYGKNTTVFKDDSARLSSSGEALFKSNNKIIGGIYMLLFADKSASMEIMLLNGDNFTLEVEKANIYKTAKFTGNTENIDFYKYQLFLVDYGKSYQKLEADLSNAKTKTDSTLIRDKMKAKGLELTNYRRSYGVKNPNAFLAKIFNAVEEPEIPTELPLLENGKKDSSYPRIYYKKHYWDKFDLKDDRLIYTPLYERKLDDYMTKLVIPVPDSVIRECDSILKVTDGHEEMFKYTLWYLTRWTETSKIMGMDEAFVYLVENYYMRDKATWIDSAQKAKYIKRAGDIAPNMIGKPAMDIRMLDTSGKKVIPLSSVKADYTILIFWSPTCGHCQKEMPKFDSLYHEVLKKYNVKIYAVEADNEVEKWKTYINEHNLVDGWVHVSDPQRTTNFRSFYDVYSTPTLYLLDENKIIRGKRIDHSNVLGLIEWLEKKKKTTASGDKK